MKKIDIAAEDVLDHKAECLVLFCPEKKPSGLIKTIDDRFKGAISAAMESKRFEGKLNQILSLSSKCVLGADNLILVGLGALKDLNEEKVRQTAGTSAKVAERSKFNSISFYISDPEFNKISKSGKSKSGNPVASAITEGALLGLYHFDEYKTPDKDNPPSRIKTITLITSAKAKVASIKKGVESTQLLCDAVISTRDLMHHPSNKATPTYLADTAKKIAKKYKFTCKVLNKEAMEKEKMGSLLGVAKGSHEPPKFIVMEYFGGKKKQAPITIVGKGITFDTGGISLKPGANMDEMKFDMSGGAVTIGTLQAAASLKLPVNVIGIIPATENMPGGSAIKPGDILKASNGKTIEVLNTDAEGRLILADALVYAQKYKPKAIIDLATLTGACIVALGHEASAIIGNDEKLIQKLIKCGTAVGERVWELPLYDEFEKAVKSDIADLKNIGSPGVGAGSATAAAFLKPFVGDFPWAHFDIAGTAWTSQEKPYVPKGGSGYGVRLLVNYLRNL